jgi:prepilin-type N-terminal cleavage/methylation domain-containing protein
MNTQKRWTCPKGMTLIELVVALAMSGLLVAGVYRTFIQQQKTYIIQEQVVDMQQNVRASISRMMEEIRMAGFGHVSMVLPVSLGGRTFAHVLNLDSPAPGALTMVSATGGTATITGIPAQNQIIVSALADGQGNPLFDTSNRKYLSVGGLESHTISAIDSGTKTITLNSTLKYNHVANSTLVFGIRAITYQVVNEAGILTLKRDENAGAGPQPLADHIENIQFEYFNAAGNVTANPADIHVVRAAVTARTNRQDPDLKNGDGYRRRQTASNITVRNMGIVP